MNHLGVPSKVVLATWPRDVYLQHGANDLPAYRSCSGASWAERPATPTDIRYIRADLAESSRTKPAELSELRAILERVRAGIADAQMPDLKEVDGDLARGLELIERSFAASGVSAGAARTQGAPFASLVDSSVSTSPTMVAVRLPLQKAGPVDTINDPDEADQAAVVSASGFKEPILRALVGAWASDQEHADGAGSTHNEERSSSWSDVVDSVTTAITSAFAYGVKKGLEKRSPARAPEGAAIDLLALLRAEPHRGAQDPLTVAIDELLAGKRISLLDTIEHVGEALIPVGAMSRMDLSSAQVNALWRTALRRAGSRLLAPLYFGWAVRSLATGTTAMPSQE